MFWVRNFFLFLLAEIYFFWYLCHLCTGVYGDVHRVKILFNKKDNALVQMAEPHQAQLGRYSISWPKITHTKSIIWLARNTNSQASSPLKPYRSKEGTVFHYCMFCKSQVSHKQNHASIFGNVSQTWWWRFMNFEYTYDLRVFLREKFSSKGTLMNFLFLQFLTLKLFLRYYIGSCMLYSSVFYVCCSNCSLGQG